MSPRKRRVPQKAVSVSTSRVGAACRYTASGAYYGVKAILDERDGKYLVDWSDDLNGEKRTICKQVGIASANPNRKDEGR